MKGRQPLLGHFWPGCDRRQPSGLPLPATTSVRFEPRQADDGEEECPSAERQFPSQERRSADLEVRLRILETAVWKRSQATLAAVTAAWRKALLDAL
jgi:hypothetical protein